MTAVGVVGVPRSGVSAVMKMLTQAGVTKAVRVGDDNILSGPDWRLVWVSRSPKDIVRSSWMLHHVNPSVWERVVTWARTWWAQQRLLVAYRARGVPMLELSFDEVTRYPERTAYRLKEFLAAQWPDFDVAAANEAVFDQAVDA